MIERRLLLALLPGLLWSVSGTAQEVTLRVNALEDAEIVATISVNDERLEVADSVVDPELAGEGWYWGEFTERYEGYVHDSEIGKDLLPAEGAYVYAGPDETSRFLTTVTAADVQGDIFSVIERGLWWKVAFTKPLPVYFHVAPEAAQDAEPAEVEVAENAADATSATTVAPIEATAPEGAAEKPDTSEPEPIEEVAETSVEESLEESEPAAQAVLIEENEEEEEPVAEAEAPDESLEVAEDTPTEEPDAIEESEPEAPEPPKVWPPSVRGELSTQMRGRLVRTSKRLLFLAPKHPYELIDNRGNRLGYIDFSGAILNAPLSQFLDQEVTVIGSWSEIEDSTDIIIHARNMRAKLAR